MMNKRKIGWLSLIGLCLNFLAFGQERSLNEKYQALMETSESYNQYKVVLKSNLDAFWSEVMDSLKRNNQNMQNLSAQLSDQKVAVDSLNSTKIQLRKELEESLANNDSISFLSISFTKIGYHVMVWGIIFVLAVLGTIIYFMFLKSNKVTIKSKKELEALKLSYEQHKNKARQHEIKLKRELQTAINTLEETRRNRG
ncbi:MAG: hypothetical protein AAGC64_10905 [Bacteroidota bacterium]